MKWFSAMSVGSANDEGIHDVISQLKMSDLKPDLICLFITTTYIEHAKEHARLIHAEFPNACLIGASGSGVISQGNEIENRDGISLIAAELPEVELKAISFSREQLRVMGPHEWRALVNIESEQQPCFVVLCDPYGFDPAHVIRHLNKAYKNAPIVGGVSSGGRDVGQNILFCGEKILREGALILGLYGDIELTPLLSQGCRPIGPVMKVTQLKRNMIETLNGKRVVEQLQSVIDELPNDTASHFRQSPMIGISNSEGDNQLAVGDFKIRSVLGVSQNYSGMAVGGYVEEGDWVQFHVRDSKSASRILHKQLKEYASMGISPQGALLFSCIGRGKQFFGVDNHDSSAFQTHFPSCIAAGLFCNGEIGAAKSSVQVHGYSCSMALFSTKMWS